MLALVAACLATATATWAQTPQVHARGQALLAPFKAALQQALKSGLAEGPAAAVDACRLEAPELARRASQDGVRVGRTSHRLRNPANVAPEWVVPILDRYRTEPSNRKPAAVALGEGRTGYVEPIVLAPLCATCHGEALAPDLAARIEALYPEDRAVGFRPGELRGVFWVEMPAESPPR